MERIAGDQREGRNRPRLKNRKRFSGPTISTWSTEYSSVRAPETSSSKSPLRMSFNARKKAIPVGPLLLYCPPRQAGVVPAYPSGAAVERPMISSFKYRNTETQPLAAQGRPRVSLSSFVDSHRRQIGLIGPAGSSRAFRSSGLAIAPRPCRIPGAPNAKNTTR